LFKEKLEFTLKCANKSGNIIKLQVYYGFFTATLTIYNKEDYSYFKMEGKQTKGVERVKSKIAIPHSR